MMNRFLQILFWSIISAAFIGPGTVTTAASSGARWGYSLLWALLFSTVACLVLQEASARVTVMSKRSLAQVIRERYRAGASGVLTMALVLGAIVLGCAAYQAGNILGSVAGARLGMAVPPQLLTLGVGVLAGLLLWFGTTAVVARMLGFVVAVMGATFLACAVLVKPAMGPLLRGLLVPSLPAGSSLLVLGLIGTTVVPYNLFLGSGIAGGQKLGDMRFGLSVAVVLGGLISMGVLVVGTAVVGPFGFDSLADTLSMRLGTWAALFFAFGLFAAGFSSAITAPMAAAVTAKGLLDRGEGNRWTERSWRYRAVWLGVLTAGVAFGLAGVRPIPAIIIAQALNGVLLPFVAVFLFIVVNDRSFMGESGVNGAFSNAVTGLVVAVTIVLGVYKTAQAVTNAFDLPTIGERPLLFGSAAVTAILAWPLFRAIRKRRGAQSPVDH
jgi:Mn2+/Fe2+ NRAMP family transporter